MLPASTVAATVSGVKETFGTTRIPIVGRDTGSTAVTIDASGLGESGVVRLESSTHRCRPGTAGTSVQGVPATVPAKLRPEGRSMSAATGPMVAPATGVISTPRVKAAPSTTRSGSVRWGLSAAPVTFAYVSGGWVTIGGGVGW